jgi:group I intron endonuclease
MNTDTGVYLITLNGETYVGSAYSFRLRWKAHINALAANRHHSPIFQRHYNKYGGVLDFSVLARCAATELLIIEQRFLDRIRPTLNCAPRAGSNLGQRWTEAQRAAMRGKYGRPVRCETTGEIFPSANEALRWLNANGTPAAQAASIAKCCRRDSASAYGHVWRFADDDTAPSRLTDDIRALLAI